MATFHIFYFRHNVLDHAEQVEARDVVEAVRMAAAKRPELRAEIWSKKGKVGVVGRSRVSAHHHSSW